MRTYLFVYSEEYNSEYVREWLDSHPNIYDWIECLPFGYFFVSNQLANDLSQSLIATAGAFRYIIIDTGIPNKQGRLPKQVWRMMTRPRPRNQLQLPFAKEDDDELE